MLRAIVNKSWKQHPTKQQLYDHLPPISKTIQNKTDKACVKLLEKQWGSHKRRSPFGTLHMDVPVLADPEEHTYNGSVRTEKKEQMARERESKSQGNPW